MIAGWAIACLIEPERLGFWETFEDRWRVRSIILTSHLPVSRWRAQIADPMASLTDRFTMRIGLRCGGFDA